MTIQETLNVEKTRYHRRVLISSLKYLEKHDFYTSQDEDKGEWEFLSSCEYVSPVEERRNINEGLLVAKIDSLGDIIEKHDGLTDNDVYQAVFHRVNCHTIQQTVFHKNPINDLVLELTDEILSNEAILKGINK